MMQNCVRSLKNKLAIFIMQSKSLKLAHKGKYLNVDFCDEENYLSYFQFSFVIFGDKLD